jgi:3-isopropylmalate/(R)-2-methylmalate dehydratase small subunit
MNVAGPVLVVARAHIDTDQIIPAHRLTGITKGGLGQHLFAGMTGGPELLATQPDAAVLVTGENFGCGSSREHAAWALVDRGFRAVVAPSFARIFLENAYANGLVPIALEEPGMAAARGATHARVDVASERIVFDDRATFEFTLDPLRKQFVMGGGFLDFLAARIPEIRTWETARSR